MKQIGIVTALLATFAVGAAAQESSSNQSKDGGAIIGGVRKVDHAVGNAAIKTAEGIERVGKDTPKVVEGAAVGTAEGARTLIVKTPTGAEETLRLTNRCVIDTGKGVVKGSEYTAKEGERVTVHYTEAGSRKVWGLLKRL